MYKRVVEQVSVNMLSMVLGFLSVFLIISVTTKDDYGNFVAALALQYVIMRLILSGILIELQLSFSESSNTSKYVPVSLLINTFIVYLLAVLLILILRWNGLIEAPLLGIFIGIPMILNVINISCKAWTWYRLSSIGSELLLLLCLIKYRHGIDINTLYDVYVIYYGGQGLIAAIGVLTSFGHFKLNRKGTMPWFRVFTGSVATVGIMGRDRLTVAVAGFIFLPESIAELAYLMIISKAVMSVCGTLNSVKFVHLAGLSKSLNLTRKFVLIENLVIGIIALVGYLALYSYTIYLGNPDYTGTITVTSVLMMVLAIVLNFNHSIWYSNQVLRKELGVFNISILLFLVLCTALVLIHLVLPGILNAMIFYVVTQIILFLSAVLVRRFYVL